MKRTVFLVCLLCGMVVFAGGVAGIGTDTSINETTSTSVSEPADTTMPDTMGQEATNTTPRQQRAITNQSGRNQSNVTVPINSTTLSGQNCSVSVATTGNVTIPIAKSGDETVATANVSAGWLVYTNRVERVNEQVNEHLSEWVTNTSAIRSTSIGRSNNTTVQGDPVTRVVVGVAPEQVNEVREEIPRQINCVEIAVEPTGRIVASGGGASASVNESTAINANISTMTDSTVVTATDSTTTVETDDTTSQSTTTSSSGSGFGIGVTVVAVCALVFVRRRR
jgi:hypothetical protein